MPKKTKKDKILAEYRRKLQSLSQTPATHLSSVDHTIPVRTEKSPTAGFSLPASLLDRSKQEPINITLTNEQISETILIRKDLQNTLLLVLFMLALELGLWRVLR